jgi:predicted MFS family arabinose efflux permease
MTTYTGLAVQDRRTLGPDSTGCDGTPPEPARAPEAQVTTTVEGTSRSAVFRLALLVSIVATFLAGSSAPTPLYATYQHAWGFSLITTTVVFAVYALAVLTGLLFLGRLSDHVGRRPVILGAITVQVVAMLVFAWAGSLDELFAGRILQGIATGAALGAIGAAMIEAHARHGAAANSAAPAAGTGIGALLSGLLVTYLPAPTHTVYVALATVLVAQLAAATTILGPSRRQPGAWRSLTPRLAAPAETRRVVIIAVPVLFAVWALAGFYGSLSPALLGSLSRSSSVVLGGFGLFLLASVASLTTIALRDAQPSSVLRIGLMGLTTGVIGVLLAISAHSTAGLLLATAVSGVGFGSGFQGALRTVLAKTPAADRAAVLSTVYVVSYLGMGIPAVAAGWFVVHGHAVMSVAQWYGVALLVLTTITAFSLRGLRRPPA